MLGVVSAMVFLVKAGMFTGAFYIQTAALLIASVLMTLYPPWAHLIFGIVGGGCFFIPGYQYARRRRRQGPAPEPSRWSKTFRRRA